MSLDTIRQNFIEEIDGEIARLQQMRSVVSGVNTNGAHKAHGNKGRTKSDVARANMSAAQLKRAKAMRVKTPAAPPGKRTGYALTEAGRKKLSDTAKKRWAAAKQASKGKTPKKLGRPTRAETAAKQAAAQTAAAQ